MGEAERFLAAVTATCPDDQWGYLWTLDGSGDEKKTYWFQPGGVDEIAGLATNLGPETNVYFGVGTSNKRGTGSQRIKMDRASGIYGLWADVDIRDPNRHKKLNLPPDRESAMEVLNLGGLQPTVVVDSGHGLHAWWLFAEFWSFESPDDVTAAATLAQRWHATLRVRAADRGWILDSVFDLSRVLRVPGTVNHKGENGEWDPTGVPVTILDLDESRCFSPGDFDDYLVDEAEVRRLNLPSTRTYLVDKELTFDENARPPVDKVDALRMWDERFAGAMDRNRPDFADQSPSSFDLSLATIAATAHWEDQEILDLLLYCRRQHGEDLKLKNTQYYRRTIAKAHEVAERDVATEEISESVEIMQEAKADEDDETISDARRKVFDTVSALIGLEVTGAHRYTSDPPEFAVVIGGHMVHLGEVKHLEGQANFRSKVLASDVGQAIPRLKTPEWDQIVQAIRHACVDQDVGRESTEIGSMGVWLGEYLLDRTPMEDAHEAALSQYPYLDEAGRVCLFPKPFMRWVFTSRGERIDNRTMGRVLRQMGASTDQVALNGSGRTTRQVWVLPPGYAAMGS